MNRPQPDYEAYRKVIEDGSTADNSTEDEGAEEDEYFSAEEIAAYLEVSLDDFFSRAAHADLQPVEGEGKPLYAGKAVRRFLINLGILEGESQW